MTFNYYEDVENPENIYDVLPLFDKEDCRHIHDCIHTIETKVGHDLEDAAKAVESDLDDILSQCSCTTEKDSVFDFITTLLKVNYFYDSRLDIMISVLENAIYNYF